MYHEVRPPARPSLFLHPLPLLLSSSPLTHTARRSRKQKQKQSRPSHHLGNHDRHFPRASRPVAAGRPAVHEHPLHPSSLEGSSRTWPILYWLVRLQRWTFLPVVLLVSAWILAHRLSPSFAGLVVERALTPRSRISTALVLSLARTASATMRSPRALRSSRSKSVRRTQLSSLCPPVSDFSSTTEPLSTNTLVFLGVHCLTGLSVVLEFFQRGAIRNVSIVAAGRLEPWLTRSIRSALRYCGKRGRGCTHFLLLYALLSATAVSRARSRGVRRFP